MSFYHYYRSILANMVEGDKLIDFFVKLPYVSADKIGLDPRCGNLFVAQDFIAVPLQNKEKFENYSGLALENQRKSYIQDYDLHIKDDFAIYEVADSDGYIQSYIDEFLKYAQDCIWQIPNR